MTITESNHAVTSDDDDDRFNAFFSDRHGPMIGLACSMVDQRSVAEEIVQESFQQVWLRWDTLTEPTFYLRTTVTNRCNDELRRRRVRREHWRAIPDQTPPERHYIADALSSVTPKRRTALVLRYYGGHSLSEVAAAMDIPTGTAKSLIHRGLADLRGAFH